MISLLERRERKSGQGNVRNGGLEKGDGSEKMKLQSQAPPFFLSFFGTS